MKHESLETLINTLASKPPALSSDTAFRDAVWREIRHRKAVNDSPSHPWREYLSLQWQPQFGVATIAIAIGVSFVCSFLLSLPEHNSSRDQLNLQVFSPTATGLPSTALVLAR